LKKSCLFGKKDPIQENFQKFVPKGFIAIQIHVLCANFVKFGRLEVGESRVVYLTKNFLSLSRFCAVWHPKSARASGKQCTQSVPNFIQIGSLLRKHRSNAP